MSESPNLTIQCDPPGTLPRILIVGQPDSPEFQTVQDDLLSTFPEEGLEAVRDLDELSDCLSTTDVPDLIVFVQTWSDEFPFSKLISLPSIGPLTRLSCVHGPWCAADGRSRQDWPLALRIPLEHFRSELASFGLTGNDSNRRATDPIPWTAGRDEVYALHYSLLASERPIDISSRSNIRRMRIDSPDRKLKQLWRDLFQMAGWQADDEATSAFRDVVLWDADQPSWNRTNAEVFSEWNSLKSGVMESKLIVMTGFLTPDVVARCRALEANAVVSKLLPLADLVAEIERI